MLSCKSYAFTLIKKFVAYVKNQFHRVIKIIRTDNAFDLRSSLEGTKYFQSMGILHQKSTPHTPQQNGIVERKHKHILEVGISLYIQSSSHTAFWNECVKTIVNLINRIPTKALKMHPYEIFMGHTPNLSHLRIFGCLCLIATSPIGSDKFMSKSFPFDLMDILVAKKLIKF